MDDVKIVQMLDGQNNFCQIELGSLLLEIDLLIEKSSKITSRHVLQEEHVHASLRKGECRFY